jgi:hypothetical protein
MSDISSIPLHPFEHNTTETKVYTPQTIAAIIVSDEKKHPCTRIIQLQKNSCEAIIFEFFLTILLECIICDTNNFEKTNTKSINKKALDYYIPHMQNIGCILKIDEYDRKELDNHINYYCRIELKKINENLFMLKNLSTNYHFSMRQIYTDSELNELKLTNMYALFHTRNNTIIKISFKLCNHSNHQTSILTASKIVNVADSI